MVSQVAVRQQKKVERKWFSSVQGHNVDLIESTFSLEYVKGNNSFFFPFVLDIKLFSRDLLLHYA